MEPITEPFQLYLESAFDVVAPLGEFGQHIFGDACDFGDPMLWCFPLHTQTTGQLGAVSGVVERGKGPLVADEGAGVQRQPSTVRSPDTVGDHRVSVELGVETAAGVLSEHPHHDPLSIHMHDVAVLTKTSVGVTLHPPHDRSHGAVMRLDHMVSDLVVSEGKQH
jgi:hypothetical protein